MDMAVQTAVIKQHLIDPEICIRCNTCESICPVGAITHDSRNYVVDVSKCNWCNDCISPCPTGSIDNWRTMPLARAYTIEEQLTWEELPPELTPDELAAEGVATSAGDTKLPSAPAAPTTPMEPGTHAFRSAQYGATVPPWSAAHPYTNLVPPRSPTTATVVGMMKAARSRASH